MMAHNHSFLHTMLRVGDLDRSIKFYSDVLGMQVLRREDYPDGKFTLEAVACLGCCSLAPVAKIADEIYGNLQTKDVARIIKQERA